MNTRQRRSYVELANAAYELGHWVTEKPVPGGYGLRCSCGWSGTVYVRNALGLDALCRKHAAHWALKLLGREDGRY